MQTTAFAQCSAAATPTVGTDAAKPVYNRLAMMEDRPLAAEYLEQRLAEAAALPSDLPDSLDEMADWIARHTDAVGTEYREYLASRKAGAPRRYFQNKAQALYFLKAVAPTKLVDGAWLYGVLQRWDDEDFRPLIRIYLEELGNGVPDKNHVLIYRKLLAQHGCEHWQDLPDTHFVQGAIQLALAQSAETFLPELIGYNLGYEQLPLHLLITSYELNELGIDPYYFTLHVTVDNAATGHAHTALEGLKQIMPRVGDASDFLRRVANGFRLNDLGVGTTQAIASFDLERETVAMLAAKSTVGKNMHSDYCRVAGRTVNDWLADPAQIPTFLEKLEGQGWIRRGEPAANSRFWKLIHGERAEMFGVFSPYEQQLLQDWIATPRAGSEHAPSEQDGDTATPRVLSHRAMLRSMESLNQDSAPRSIAPRGLIRHRFPEDEHAWESIGCELRLLEARLAATGSKDEAMDMLVGLMAPDRHHTSAGLMATRVFSRLYG
ncbi:iron-containing redox enzyme family protein [Pseudoduganella chitinolytica]|uniref:Iron-containing redox enzyme family protein n=1 Tax=Pseudoduganella chitinolytica TaxID=34070 RepID=A0ABY8BEX3_9BURK|nr:iron-containing redox enzyme family protein [Pseudoduganella chitinolytica]WEF34454.1 iron-containing redox enzyme family protein [Pseudoduganella chitinolytica]